MFEWMLSTDGWFAFATLFAMEVVLGIDNIVFISILAAKLPVGQQASARYIGLGLALVMRVALLFAITWIMSLSEPLFEILGHKLSGRDLVLVLGGLFLIGKAVIEIHGMVEGSHAQKSVGSSAFAMVIAQIVAIDVVFSIDSILTAVGLTKDINIMIAAVVASMAVMILAAAPLSAFIHKYPTTKMLALAFLVMIGAMLVAHGFGLEFPKGYIYSAMAFAVIVELLNIAVRRAARGRGLEHALEPTDAVDGLLLRAMRQGGTAIQFVADEQGAARAWISRRDSLVEDEAFPALPWPALKGEIERRAKARTVKIDGVDHAVTAAVAAPDMRPAAVLDLKPA